MRFELTITAVSRRYPNQLRLPAHKPDTTVEPLLRFNRGVLNRCGGNQSCLVILAKKNGDGLYKAIYTRRDVRSHFTSRPVCDAVLAKILHAAHHAPSVGFSQPWNFILVKNEQTRCRIKESF